MMKSKKRSMRMLAMLLIMIQLVSLASFSPSFAVVGVDDIPQPSNPEKRLLLTNKDLFLNEVFNDPQFISDWAYLAHYLGIGWCGGTGENGIGQDFDVRKIDNQLDAEKYKDDFDDYNNLPFWVIEANYDKNDPYADGYRSDERLKMFITDAAIMFDADTLEFGPALHSELEPEAVVSKVIRNFGSTDLTSVVQSDFSDSTSKTVTHGINIGTKFGVANETEAGGKIFGIGVNHKTTVSFELSAGYNWSKATMDSHTLSRMAQERVSVPPNRKMSATIYALKSKVSFPYQGDVVPVYNMTLSGFYRYKDNSSWGHDESRPDARIKFGNFSYESSDEAVEGMNALDDLMNQYINRSIEGNSQTDWQWVLDKYTPYTIKNLIGKIAKTKYVARINGRFSQVDGAIFQSVIKDLGALGNQDVGLPEQTDHDSDPVHGGDSLSKPQTESRINLAKGKTVTSSGYMQNRGPEKAFEGYVGEINDCWQSLDKQNAEPNGGSPDGYLGEWIKVDLGGLRKIDHVAVSHAGAFGYSPVSNNRTFTVYVSDDDKYYTSVKVISDNTEDRTDIALQDEDVTGRYVKVLVNRPGYFPDMDAFAACIYDLAIYGYDFEPVEYNVTYAGNGNTSGHAPSDDEGHYRHTNVIVKDNVGNLDRTGYDFAGWTTNPDGTGTIYNPGESFKMTGRDLTLYAKWEETKDVAYKKAVTANHSISYHPAENAVNGTMRNLEDKWCTTVGTGNQWLEVDLGQSYDIDSWMVKHAGAFGEDNGYNTKAFKLQYKEVDTWRDAAVVTNNTDSVTEGTVNPFRARFVRLLITEPTNNGDPAARIFQFKVFGEAVSDESYHVYYDGNGALEGSAPVDDNEYRINDAVQVKPNTGNLVNPGYRFAGWNTLPDGSGDDYESRSYFRISGDYDVTLYAKWEKDSDLTNVTKNKALTASGEMAEHPASNIVDGYVDDQSDKWATDSYPKWVRVDLGDTYEISRWIVLHAEAGGESEDYNTRNYELRVSETNEDESSFRTIDFVSDNTASFTDRTLSNPVNARYVELKINDPNSANDLFARIYQFEVYGKPCKTVFFDDNDSTGGSTPADIKCAEASTVSVPYNTGILSKDGYRFLGWNTESNGTGTSYAEGDTFPMTAEDITLYAEWKASEFTNVALNKSVEQSSTDRGASADIAVDGITKGDKYAGQITRTEYETNPWWIVDLGKEYEIDSIDIYSMLDNPIEFLDHYEVSILDTNKDVVWSEIQYDYPEPKTVLETGGAKGQYVKVQLRKYGVLQLAEVQVFGKEVMAQPKMMTMMMDMPLLESPLEYQVTYDGNGNDVGRVPVDESKYLKQDQVKVLGPDESFFKENFAFLGWNTLADGSGVTYYAGDVIDSLYDNITLYAQWAEMVSEEPQVASEEVVEEAIEEPEEAIEEPKEAIEEPKEAIEEPEEAIEEPEEAIEEPEEAIEEPEEAVEEPEEVVEEAEEVVEEAEEVVEEPEEAIEESEGAIEEPKEAIEEPEEAIEEPEEAIEEPEEAVEEPKEAIEEPEEAIEEPEVDVEEPVKLEETPEEPEVSSDINP